MVGADSRGISRAPRYLGEYDLYTNSFEYGAVTLYGHSFQSVRLKLVLRLKICTLDTYIPLPTRRNVYTLTRRMFLADPISLTTTEGIAFAFFSWPYLDVSVQAVAFLCLYIQHRMLRVHPERVSPFRNLRIIA